jgi:DNA-binding response OmpR family regulator
MVHKMKQAVTKHTDILIIDDAPDTLNLLSRMLENHGYPVRTAINGQIALQKSKLAPPALILLDIVMPSMDGYEVCARLKADPLTRDIPIIFLSALDDSEGKVRAFEAGAVDYVTKPFHAEEVLARIRTHLALQGAQKQLKAQNLQLQSEVYDRSSPEKTSSEAKDEWDRTFDALPDLICIFDQDFRVLRLNRALAHRLKRKPQDCIGQSCDELFHDTESSEGHLD